MPNTLDKESREQIHEIKENAREGIKAAKEDYKLDKQEALEDTGMEAKVAVGATVTSALLLALLPPPINLIGLATLLPAVWGTVSVVNDLDKWNDARVEKNDIVSATRQERKELLAITKNDARIRQKDVSVNAKLAAEALEIDVKGRDAEGRLANQGKKQGLKLRLQNMASRMTGDRYMPDAVRGKLATDIGARRGQVQQAEEESAGRGESPVERMLDLLQAMSPEERDVATRVVIQALSTAVSGAAQERPGGSEGTGLGGPGLSDHERSRLVPPHALGGPLQRTGAV